MRGIGFLALLLTATSLSCKEDNAPQSAGTVDAKLPIVVYYTLPG